MALVTQAKLETAFAMIIEAALKNERCPKDVPLGPIPVNAVMELIGRRWVDSHVSSQNYRTIVILVGEHAGKTTLSDGAPVWKINGKRVGVAQRVTLREPSAPRLLNDPRNSDANSSPDRGPSG